MTTGCWPSSLCCETAINISRREQTVLKKPAVTFVIVIKPSTTQRKTKPIRICLNRKKKNKELTCWICSNAWPWMLWKHIIARKIWKRYSGTTRWGIVWWCCIYTWNDLYTIFFTKCWIVWYISTILCGITDNDRITNCNRRIWCLMSKCYKRNKVIFAYFNKFVRYNRNYLKSIFGMEKYQQLNQRLNMNQWWDYVEYLYINRSTMFCMFYSAQKKIIFILKMYHNYRFYLNPLIKIQSKQIKSNDFISKIVLFDCRIYLYHIESLDLVAKWRHQPLLNVLRYYCNHLLYLQVKLFQDMNFLEYDKQFVEHQQPSYSKWYIHACTLCNSIEDTYSHDDTFSISRHNCTIVISIEFSIGWLCLTRPIDSCDEITIE